MTVRPVMAEDTTPPLEVQDESDQAVVEESNGDSADQGESSGTSSPVPPGSIPRTRGSKVSNLRAAFEQGGSGSNTGSRSITPSSRIASFDADFARLKDVMAKEQESREADRQRVQMQDTEIERLRDLVREEQEQREADLQRLATQSAEIERLEAVLDNKKEHRKADLQRLEMQDTEIGQLKEQIEKLQQQVEDMERDGSGVESVQNTDMEREELLNSVHEARAMVEASAAEASALRSQLAELKKSIATNTRIESHEMTDSAIQGELGTLCYQVQDWVINRFRKTKIEDDAEELAKRVPADTNPETAEHLTVLLKQWDPTMKMLIMQSVVAVLLMPVFQDALPYGLPPHVEWSEAVRAASRGLQNLLDTAAYNRWRATTFDIICHSEAMSPFVHAAANKIVDQICTAVDGITTSTSSEAQTDALRNVARRVIALSHSLRIQRAVYDVQLPPPASSFDPNTMDDVSDDYEGPEERNIRCAIFPAVSKSGSGGQVGIIFKARIS